MGTKVPDEIVQAIRERADIVAIVGEVVELRRAGVGLKGLCPFHQEKTPSFTVSPARGTYHCFGCDAHGDPITFVRETRNLSFIEALRLLGDKVGVPVPEVQVGAAEAAEDRENRERRQWLLKAHELAEAFFARALDRADGEEGRRYLARRGIGADIVAGFALGYADAAWDSLTAELARNGVPPRYVVESGLARERQGGGGLYDFFRRRLVCPVRDPMGRTVAFGARALAPEDEERAKYVNSPESAIFKKGRTLFGLDRARTAIRRKERAVLVEGNFDVLSLHQAGLDETVASLGTALTTDQVRLLHRQTEHAVLLYDGDAAGRKSALKAVPLLAEEGLVFRVAELPAGVDPDDYVRTEGVAALTALLDRATPGIEWAIRSILPGRDAPPEAKEQAVTAVGRLVDKVASPIARTEYRALTADLLGVDERAVARHFAGAVPVSPELRARPGRTRRRFHGPHLLRLLVAHPEVAAQQDPAAWGPLLDGEELGGACVAAMAAAAAGRRDLEAAALDGAEGAARVAAGRALHEASREPDRDPAVVAAEIRERLRAEKQRKNRVSPLRGVLDNDNPKRQT